ncbi:MAG: oppC 4 [Paenibacillus sp.]|nr:oppC 4 [Paenibacillus sp.]
MNKRIWDNLRRELLERKLGLAALLLLAIFTIASLLAFLSPYDPNQIVVQDRLQAPNGNHWFGTDDYGRDYFTRALYGGRISLSVALLAMLIATVVGTAIGTISGFIGGRLDALLMRLVDIFMSVPSFLIMLIVSVYFKPGIQNIILIIGLLTWMNIARLVRAETLSIKEREYVLYATISGQSRLRTITMHIIPNIISTVIVSATINIATAILMESSLSFLGLGIQQPNSSWGSMLNNAQGFISDAPYLAIFPGLFILLTVLSFNVLGDLLRVAFEPRVNQR